MIAHGDACGKTIIIVWREYNQYRLEYKYKQYQSRHKYKQYQSRLKYRPNITITGHDTNMAQIKPILISVTNITNTDLCNKYNQYWSL